MTTLHALAGVVLLFDAPISALVWAAPCRAARTRMSGRRAPHPTADALTGRQARYFEQPGELRRRYPDLDVQTGGHVAAASAVVPLFDGQAVGVLVLAFRDARVFTR